MSLFQQQTGRRTPSGIVAGWWRKWMRSVGSFSELQGCSDADVGRMARDVGLLPHDLRGVVRRGPHAADLLQSRMAVLDLSPQEVAEVDRATFLDLARVCTNCDCKGRCKRDLARHPDDTVWEDYCPNVATLKMLNAMPWASRREW